jgi:hypothetical protein
LAYEYNESGIESSYDIHDWSNNVIISDTRMDSIDKGIVNLYNAIFGNEAENINGIIHHFEGKNNTVNNIIGTRPNDNNDTIFDNITNLWHNIKDESNLDGNGQEISRTPYGRIVDLENNLGTRGNNNDPAFVEINNLKNDLGTRGNNNDPAFVEIETAKGRINTLETNLGPAAQDAQNKNTAFDRIATLETNLETLTTNIQPDLKIIENSNIISIDDAAPLDAEEFVVDIEPVQDLHGYDSPWPAGGGKNLYNSATFPSQTKNGITCTNNGDGSFTLNGTATTDIFFDVFTAQFSPNSGGTPLPSAEYRLTGCPSGGSSQTYYLYTIPNYHGSYGSGVTFTDEILGGSIYVKSGVTLNNLVFNPMIRLASNGDDTFTPYSNICPISGWTGAKVSRTGKNLLDYSVFQQYANWSDSIVTYGNYQTSIGNKGYLLPVVSGMTYTVSLGISSSSFPTFCYICRANGNDTSERVRAFTTGSFSTASITFTAESGWIYYVRIGSLASESAFTTQMEKVSSAQLELGSTATDYEPYQGDTYDITFPSEAGTVYGGTLDVVNGVLTVDRAMEVLDGDEDWDTYNPDNYDSYCFVMNKQTKKVGSLLSICNEYKNVSGAWSSGGNNVFGVFSDHSSLTRWYFTRPTSTFEKNVTAWKAWLAENPLHIVYPLATPITYQLTPPAITLLRGNNNIWADCGNITMKYWQDKVLYENFYTKTQTNNLLLPLNEITTLDNRMVALEETLEDTVREETDKALLKTTFKLTLPYLTASILTKEKEYKIRLLDINYPIGSIYMTLNNADPKNILGGKWIPISQGRVLLGAGNNISDGTTTKSFTVGSTGGEYNHKLIIDEMPAHNHSVYYPYTKGTETGSVLTRTTKTKRKSTSDVIINKGGNVSHNNIQPYLVCNIWQRVIEDIHDVMRAMDSGTYTHLFKVDNEVPLIIDDNTTIIMVIDQIDTKKNYVYFRQKYTEGMEPCSNSAIDSNLIAFKNSIPSDVKLALVGNPTLPEATTLDGVEVWATSNQGDTEAQYYLLPRICLKTIDMGVSSNIVDAEDSGHSF